LGFEKTGKGLRNGACASIFGRSDAHDSLVYVLIPVRDFQLPIGFCGSWKWRTVAMKSHRPDEADDLWHGTASLLLAQE
jgi:hypothetical protein